MQEQSSGGLRRTERGKKDIMRKPYRVWYSNWDAHHFPVDQAEATEEVESEMALGTEGMLVTRGDLTREQTLAAVDSLRRLIETSPF
jgi:hypothetical protein